MTAMTRMFPKRPTARTMEQRISDVVATYSGRPRRSRLGANLDSLSFSNDLSALFSFAVAASHEQEVIIIQCTCISNNLAEDIK